MKIGMTRYGVREPRRTSRQEDQRPQLRMFYYDFLLVRLFILTIQRCT